MPIYEYGDMWDAWDDTDLFLFTSNNVVTRYEALVMGAGLARDVRDRWPGVDKILGAEVRKTTAEGFYGLLLSPNGGKLGAFQVKYHYKEKADLDLIKKSTAQLAEYANANPGKRIDLNFPGIGNGGLDPTSVIWLINELPENVHIWRYEERTKEEK